MTVVNNLSVTPFYLDIIRPVQIYNLLSLKIQETIMIKLCQIPIFFTCRSMIFKTHISLKFIQRLYTGGVKTEAPRKTGLFVVEN